MGKKCVMYRKGLFGNPDYCNGYDLEACPNKCPYEVSKAEQKNKEREIMLGIFNRRPYLYYDFKSLVTGDVLIYADEFNAETMERERTGR